jgi:hypothetical protein
MKKLLFLETCLVALASQPVLVQTGGPDVVAVRFVYEAGTKFHTFISRGTGKTKEQQAKGGNALENESCQQVIAKLYQEGYTLRSTFSSGNVPTNSLLFTKDK